LIAGVLGAWYMVYVYRTAAQPMLGAQKLDFMFTAPINTTLTMSVNGMVTLRGYRKFHHFRESFMEAIEKSANSTFCYNALNRFIGIRLDFLCVAFGTATAALSIFLKNSVDP